MNKSYLALISALLGMFVSVSASAHDHDSAGFSISFGQPIYYSAPPVYYAPPPVYYARPTVYYAPQPVYFGGDRDFREYEYRHDYNEGRHGWHRHHRHGHDN